MRKSNYSGNLAIVLNVGGIIVIAIREKVRKGWITIVEIFSDSEY